VSKLMGAYARSRATYEIVRRVLEGHLIEVPDDPGQARSRPPLTRATKRVTFGTARNTQESVRSSDLHPYSSHGRGRTSSLLREKGIVHSFVNVELCTISQIFLKLARPADGEKQLCAQHIHRFIQFGRSQEPELSEEQVVCSDILPRRFENEVKDALMPNSLKNHASSMIDLINLCFTAKELQPAFPPTIRSALNKAKEQWYSIKRNAEKLARRVQRRNIVSYAPPELQVYLALSYLHTIRSSGDMEKMLAAAEDRTLDPQKEATLMCCLAIFLALHGQRRCAAENLRLSELLAAQRHHGRYCVTIGRHKTDLTQGGAVLALAELHFEALLRYAQARAKWTDDGLVLRTLDGRYISNIFQPLQDYMRARIVRNQPIRFNDFRKCIETNKKFAGEALTDKQCDSIHVYLSHSRTVTKQFYEYRTPAIVCQDAREVENTLFQTAVYQLIESDSSPNLLPGSALGKIILRY